MWLRRFLPHCISMSFNTKFIDRKPLVVILGATGTGKSKLALEIAKKYNGEVISADSMQVYKGLDIITNKVSAEERQQAQHHLLDFVDPLQDFHIQQFRDLAVSAIEQLHAKSKLPILVGGTHYYIESVLWKVLVTSATKEPAASASLSQTHLGSINSYFSGGNGSGDTSCDRMGVTSKYFDFNSTRINSNDAASGSKHTADQRSFSDIPKTSSIKSCSPTYEREGMDTTPVSTGENPAGTVEPQTLLNYARELPDATEDLYEKLGAIDPERAKMLHPKDRRKIIRSLQVWQQTGEKHSDHIRRQQEEVGGNVLGGGLRYPNTVVFWLHSDQAVLDTRLDARVDDMLQNGLLTELLDFHEHYNKTRLRQGAASVDAPAVGKAPCTLESVMHNPGGFSGAVVTSCLNPVDLSSGDPSLTGTPSTTRSPDGIGNKADMNSETLNNSLADQNGLKGSKVYTSSRSSSSGNDTIDVLDGGQKNSASFDDNTRNKRLKLDSDCIDHTDTETKFSSAEEVFEPVSFSTVVDKHPNNTGKNTQCHGDSAASARLQPSPADYSQGIFQSIGFKEFHQYLVLLPKEKNSERGKKLRQSGVDLMKLATRRYARRQVKWIKNRFTKDLERPVPPIYRLDVTDPGDWEAAVGVPADAVVAALVADHPPPHHVVKPVEKVPAPNSEIQGRFDRHECTLCSRVFIGHEQWRAHIRGAKHKKARQRKATALLEQERAADEGGLGLEERHTKEKNAVVPLEERARGVNGSEKTMLQQ